MDYQIGDYVLFQWNRYRGGGVIKPTEFMKIVGTWRYKYTEGDGFYDPPPDPPRDSDGKELMIKVQELKGHGRAFQQSIFNIVRLMTEKEIRPYLVQDIIEA